VAVWWFFLPTEELKVDAEQAVHVGDDATADKAGAEAIGMDAW
jgi:FMN phosphatase YigB (HAD superfamily)